MIKLRAWDHFNDEGAGDRAYIHGAAMNYYNEFDPKAAAWLSRLLESSFFCRNNLVASKTMFLTMLGLCEHFKVGYGVVLLVPVFMVNVKTWRYFTINRLPNSAVQIPTIPSRNSVISISPACIFLPIPFNEGEGFGSVSQRKTPANKHLINALSGRGECFSYLGEAVAVLIQSIHSIGFFVVSVCWHFSLLMKLNFDRYIPLRAYKCQPIY